MPTHVARAYGLMKPGAPNQTGQPNPAQFTQPAGQTPGAQAPGQVQGMSSPGQVQSTSSVTNATRIEPARDPSNVGRIDSTRAAEQTTAATEAGFAEKLQGLVAGATGRPVEFDDGTQAPRMPDAGPPPHTLPLYTRSADKVEAAVAVNTGRAVDIRG